MFNIADIALVVEEHWSSANFLQESSKMQESSLHEILSADTAFLRSGQTSTLKE